MQVGVADATIRDLDLDVVRARLAAVDVDRLQRLVSGIGSIGFRYHESSPSWSIHEDTIHTGARMQGNLDQVPPLH